MSTRIRNRVVIGKMELVREIINGEVLEYAPLGRYIVAEPNLCGGRPVVKNTRVDARHIIGALRRGESIEQVAEAFRIPVAAVKEAVALADKYDYERSYA